jgi:hypothetical protein
MSDGTKEGTTLVTNINPKGDSLTPIRDPIVSDGKNIIYFAADDGVHGKELWRYSIFLQNIPLVIKSNND